MIRPIFLDIEKTMSGNKAIAELGMLCGIGGKAFSIRMRRSDDEAHLPTFSAGIKRAVAWIGDPKDVVFIGHNIKKFDIPAIREQLSLTGESALWPDGYGVFDTLDLSKRVHKGKKHHNLAALRHKYRVDSAGAHRALADCLSTRDVLEGMCKPIGNDALYSLMGRADALEQVAKRVLANLPIIPVFLDLVLSAPVKKDKFDDEPNPHVILVSAISGDKEFRTRVKLPEPNIYIRECAEGLGRRELQGKKLPTVPEMFKAFKRWTRELYRGRCNVVLIGFEAFNRDKVALEHDLDINGKKLPFDWNWFDLSYVQSCLVRGFYDRIPVLTRDGRFEALFDHLRLTPTGSRVKDLALMYNHLLGFADQKPILKAMMSFPSIKLVADLAMAAQEGYPIYFDLETTGLIEHEVDAEGNFVKEKSKKVVSAYPAITQISAKFPDGTWFTEFVKPWKEIHPEAERITKITMNPELAMEDPEYTYVGDMPTAEKVLTLFWDKVHAGLRPRQKPVLIAHNGWFFDKPVLIEESTKFSVSTGEVEYFDTCSLARAVLKGQGGKRSLQALCEKYNIVQGQAHRADSDVKDMEAVTERMIGDADPQAVYNAMLVKGSVAAVKKVIDAADKIITFSSDEGEGEPPRKFRRLMTGKPINP